jgi:hypothetical protein
MDLIKIGDRFINLDMLIDAEIRPNGALVLTMAVTTHGSAPGSVNAYSIALGGSEAVAVIERLETMSLDLMPPGP